MRVCVPTLGERGLEERVGEHFNKALTYTIVDVEKNLAEVVKNTGGDTHALKLVEEKNVDVIICSHLGHTLLPALEELGVLTYIGAYGRVKDAIRMWKGEMLHLATDESGHKKRK